MKRLFTILALFAVGCGGVPQEIRNDLDKHKTELVESHQNGDTYYVTANNPAFGGRFVIEYKNVGGKWTRGGKDIK